MHENFADVFQSSHLNLFCLYFVIKFVQITLYLNI
jgi:hypothetical protein